MTEIILVGCTDTKRDEAAAARDLYDESTLFQKRRKHARRRGEYWGILSAEHGFLRPDEWLEPYNTHINDRDPADWAEQVQDGLLPHLSDNGIHTVFITAGKKYVDPLVTPLEIEGYDVVDGLRGQGIGTRMSKLDDLAGQYRDGRYVDSATPGEQATLEEVA